MWSGSEEPAASIFKPGEGKMLVPTVLSEGTVWPSYVVFMLHSPMPN